MDKFYIMTFNNTMEAIHAEKTSKLKQIKSEVMPTPSFITKSCGICLKFDENGIQLIKKLILNKEIKFKQIYYKNQQEYTEIII